MGGLVNGVWHGKFSDVDSQNGRFVRQDSSFRGWIRADGSTAFLPAAGRYHLYVAHACPWAHRTLIYRKLKKLEDIISVSYLAPHMGDEGWTFADTAESNTDTINGKRFLHEIYTLAKPDYTGKVTVPTLWDRQLQTIVNNESSEIIRMLNSEFQGYTDVDIDYYPEALRDQIDSINAVIYDTVNNGVYQAGFASTQEAYEEACTVLFATLDMLEQRLSGQRWLVGDALTEADWRLFPTLIRFDAIYHYHFKCNLRRICDYPRLSEYLRELYRFPGIAETFNLELTKQHYFQSHKNINPTGIVPLGPETGLWVKQ